jgi:hypothetical protein
LTDTKNHLNKAFGGVDLYAPTSSYVGKNPQSSNNEVMAGMIAAMICRVLVITTTTPGNRRGPARKTVAAPRTQAWLIGVLGDPLLALL